MRLEGSERGRRNAKRLRTTMTPPEIGLWQALRQYRGEIRFRRQYAVGDYVVDFYCAAARLAIEVDGEAHSRGDRPERDTARDRWLAAQGLLVVRYPAGEVLGNLEGVVRDVLRVVGERCALSSR